MPPTRSRAGRLRRRGLSPLMQACAAALLLAVFPAVMQPQSSAAAQQAQSPAPAAKPVAAGQSEETGQAAAAPVSAAVPQSRNSAKTTSAKTPTPSERRRANRLYLTASKLYVDGHFEEAMKDYEQAAQLDPGNADYGMAAGVARGHLVTSLIQAAAKDRFTGNEAGARIALARAFALDPHNPEVTQHLYELSDDVAREQPQPLYGKTAGEIGGVEPLLPGSGESSFHVRADERQVIVQVCRTFGITAMLDDSVRPMIVRYDVDNVDFATAMRILSLVTDTFYVPLDEHRVVVARDTRENRLQFMRQALETVHLSGLDSTGLTEAGNLARNVFDIPQVATNPATSSLTLHGDPTSLDAFNASMRSLLNGTDQVMLDVRILQVGHTSSRNTGIQPPQSISAFNVYAEEQSILNANQSLVQEIISSGLASPNDPLGILGILLASGQVSSSLLSNGLALFGGGLTESALSPGGPATFNFSLNSSDTRALDNIQLRLGDGESNTIKEGERYPIQTSSYSSLSGSLPNIPGLTTAGASGSLSSLLSSLSGSTPTIPMIQYQDLGLTLKVTPKVLRGGEVALTADWTLDALSGSSLNGNPILNHQAFSGVVTLKDGEAAELASEIDESESRALSGTPGLSDVPGLNNVSNNTVQKNYATLLIIMTPHVVRATQPAGHTPAMIVEKGTTP